MPRLNIHSYYVQGHVEHKELFNKLHNEQNYGRHITYSFLTFGYNIKFQPENN